MHTVKPLFVLKCFSVKALYLKYYKFRVAKQIPVPTRNVWKFYGIAVIFFVGG